MTQLTLGSARGARVARRLRGLRATRATELLLVLPAAFLILFILYFPTANAIAHSFTDWRPGRSSEWIGLANYQELLASSTFRDIMVNQAVLLLTVPIATFAPLIVAVLLFERVPGSGAFRTVYFFAATAPPAIIGILFTFILAPSGPINTALDAMGLTEVSRNWLGQSATVKPVIILVLVWATFGIGVVIYSAALSAVPTDLLDAARLDGAGWWVRFRRVLAPLMRQSIELWSTILLISVFISVFPWVFTLTRGGPGNASTTLDFDIYQNALVFNDFGIAAAETVILFAIVIVLSILRFFLFRRRGGD